MRIVIALGGNALGNKPLEQREICKKTAKLLTPIIKEGHEVIITHGNGPQVGLINLAFNEGNKVNQNVYDMPFSECGAMSQGYIGYHLQNALYNEFKNEGIDKQVITLVTQVLVDEEDHAFKNPTKPIGSFYSLEEISKTNYPYMEDAGRGYRRVVASPKPIKVIEEDSVNSLLKSGFVVITCGGGGIPVIKKDGKLVGVDAVIDKDLASAKLASDINADMLVILTAVTNAYINFNQPNQKELDVVTVEEVIKYNEQGEFKKGSMKPKIEACINYLKETKGKVAVITSIDNAINAINLKSGTIIKGN